MKTTTSFFGLLGLTATMLFFVSCSNNDATPTANAARNGNQTMSTWNVPHGKLHIINNTNHVFEGDLLALNLGHVSDGDDYLLWQYVRIVGNSDVYLGTYHDTNLSGMDAATETPDKWNTLNYNSNSPSSAEGILASNTANSNHYMTDDNTYGAYVQWLGMDNTHSTDASNLTLKFKINHLTGEIEVNLPQHHDDGAGAVDFTTTGYVDENGLTTITIFEN